MPFRVNLTPDCYNRSIGSDQERIPLGTEKFFAEHSLWFPRIIGFEHRVFSIRQEQNGKVMLLCKLLVALR